MATTKARSRTKKRLLEIKDHLQNLDTVSHVLSRLKEPPLRDDLTSRRLVEKMISLRLIDDYTSPIVFDCLVEHLPAMSIAVTRCARGNGLDLMSRCLQDSDVSTSSSSVVEPCERSIAQTFELGRTNYTTAIKRPEDKCIFWTMAVAFFLMYYEFATQHEFLLPAPVSDNDKSEFFQKYPEFLIRSWDANDLLQFRLVMKHVVDIYGNGNNKACLVEMVTRITRGREIALTCNTSGGAMKKETIYNDETEVAAECCRVRIYQRESGVEPRRRDHPIGEGGEKQTSSKKSNVAPRLTAAELKRVPTADIKMIVGLRDAFEHDALPVDVSTATRPPAKRYKSNPEFNSQNSLATVHEISVPKLERRHSSGQNSGIESILAAAGTDDLIFDFGKPDMSRSISEDIANTMRSLNAPALSAVDTVDTSNGDDIGSLLYSKPLLTRVPSNVSTTSSGSFALSRISSTGDYYPGNNTPDRKNGLCPPKCSRVTSTDWVQYPYNQLK